MSHSTHPHDTLARTPADVDPTRTTTLRNQYAQRLRGPLGRLNATIREAVQTEDLFGLRDERDTLQPSPPSAPPDRPFRFATDDEKVEAFLRWLRRQEERGILSVIETDENTWIRSAYQRGLQHADTALREEGITVPTQELSAVFNTPVHRDAVQFLYTRNYTELQGITESMNQQISRELADGFSRGLSPTKMARNITDRVDAIGKTRATVLARTEVIRAHSEATLNRFEEFDVGEVSVAAEWTTAGDRRVCPICQALEGQTWTIQQARESTFRYDAGPDEPPSLSGEYPVRPPAHPQCRCALLPVTN